MCRFKSGLIFKNRVELAPMYNESHSTMLSKAAIADDSFNARKVFVRAELTPPNGDILADISKWNYRVDQDITPDWYDDDRDKYENEFRNAVKEWVNKNIVNVCGVPCTRIKDENENTYYHTCKPLFSSQFGSDNNYKTSDVREKLLNCEFTKELVNKYGDKLVPISLDLTSLDGLKDYEVLSDDIIGIPNIDLYRECRENVFQGDEWWWLSTPDSTSSGYSASLVRYVDSGGYVFYGSCGGVRSVRPFFILPSSISLSLS